MGAARKLYVADLFCGAGGTSMGLAKACQKLRLKVELLAINHWSVAIETHKKNFPWARHMCAKIQDVDPLLAIPGGHLDLLVASPECRWFSKARGGKPINDQARVTAWRILEWLDRIHVSNVLIENTEEFEDWAPLNVATNRPIKKLKGTIFDSFIQIIRAMNYRVEWKVLNAADFGAATTRRRLFIIARKGNRKIHWPQQTHAKDADKQPDLFTKGLKPWRAAREVIDWSIQGQSIFHRKKPLARTTLERIEAGLRKFCGKAAEPFLVILRQHMDGQSLDQPLPTLAAGGQHMALCEPSIIRDSSDLEPRLILPCYLGALPPEEALEPFILQQQSGGAPRLVRYPLPTIATAGAQALIEPFIVPFFGERTGQERRTHALNSPLPAITSHGAGALVEPTSFIITPGGANLRNGRSVNNPLPTVLGYDRFALVEPVNGSFIVNMKGRSDASSLERPLPTQTTRKHLYVAQAFIVPQNRSNQPRSVEYPVPTLTTTSRGVGLVQPFFVPFNGTKTNGQPRANSVGMPLPTQHCSNRFGLVEPSFLVSVAHGGGTGRRAHSLQMPLRTVTGAKELALIEASFLVGAGGPRYAAKPASIEEPLGTMLTENHKALVTPLIVQICNYGGNGLYARPIDDPLYTIVTENQLALVEPVLVTVNHGRKSIGRGQTLADPLRTLTGKNGFGLVEPFITKFYRDVETQHQTIWDPLHTVTTKPRHGLVEPSADQVGLDIRFRMLRPHELGHAMGLENYNFVGTIEQQVKQIGNMVEINQAMALITSILEN